ncbi:MAG: alpha/beta fold hydrolase [Sediminibacterium magnilacihabitans]|jgi:esterase/lipase|nr:alpha/beta fold hydrolase [Sediminibacterium magnilacihabitans]PQV61095.1 esterase/lipase [Sediminibacterium magnilacihabitans]
MRSFSRILLIIAILSIIFLLGPRPSKPVYNKDLPAVPAIAAGLEQYVTHIEAAHKVKPDNEARIVWANDSLKQKTPYAIVYLHGFSASQAEGNPLHRDIAREFGCNLYLSRLADHGIDTSDALVHMTADDLWETAKQAYSIGKQLGDKVILMGTSTGGTLALQLAAAYPDIAGLILLSPNIAINDPNAWMLNDHWGLQIARLVKKSDYNVITGKDSAYKQYWYTQYRLEALTQLEELLETTMNTQAFSRVKQPVLMLYYYRDEQHQDPVVKVAAMKDMFEQLGTLQAQKKMEAIPNAGAHVLGSIIVSKDIPAVEAATTNFMQDVLMLKPVTTLHH